MTPTPAPQPSNPLRKVIDDLEIIIERQTANPSDPGLNDLLLDVQVELSKAVKSIVGVADDTNRGG
jgi:hypothetical protein